MMTNPVLIYYPNGQLMSEEWLENGWRHRDSGPALRGWYENGQLEFESWYYYGKCHREGEPANVGWYKNGQLKFKSWYDNGWIKNEKYFQNSNQLLVPGSDNEGNKVQDNSNTQHVRDLSVNNQSMNEVESANGEQPVNELIELINQSYLFLKQLMEEIARLDVIKRQNIRRAQAVTNPIRTYYFNGQPKSEEWHERWVSHREDGPATQKWFFNGRLKFEIWCQYGKRHRLNSPAFRAWHKNGQLRFEYWYQDSKWHRLDGPAIQWWHENGQLRFEGWYRNGERHRLDGPAEQEWGMEGRLEQEWWFINGDLITEEKHPFVIILKQHNLYSKWWRNELTEGEQALVKLSIAT